METIKRLKELCLPVLEECNVILYDIKWQGNGKERTLEVSIMHEDGSMDLDTCALVSDRLSEVLDSAEELQTSYMLEVCSPGAEREIRDPSELAKMDEPYVFVRLKHPINKKLEWYGTVVKYEDGVLHFRYRDKAAQKETKIPEEDIDYLRLAVRL
ncbi:MAG: ribosome maturation factor RimP [Erysipelotrichaceae bacterium]|nr:ribosome maturation factor RimP [Erysipelotrichaceae bacterium]